MKNIIYQSKVFISIIAMITINYSRDGDHFFQYPAMIHLLY
jgi:hypothetical protein